MMPRIKISVIQEAELDDCDEKLRLDEIQVGFTLVKINDMSRRCKEEVDSQLNLVRETTDKKLLEMKWADLLSHKNDNFTDRLDKVSKPRASRSRSVGHQRGEEIRTKEPSWNRVQSLDRADKDDLPTMGFIRWPHPTEQMLLKAGVPVRSERLGQADNPTGKGVTMVKQLKMAPALMTLDPNTLKQVTILNANLAKIVDIASKIGKPSTIRE